MMFHYVSKYGSNSFDSDFPLFTPNYFTPKPAKCKEKPLEIRRFQEVFWLRGKDLNQRPPGYEPDELPTALPRDIDALNWCLYRIAQRRKIVKQNLSTLCDFFRRFGNSLYEITRKSVISPQSCAYAPRRPCRPRGRSSKGRSSRPRRRRAAYRSRRIARHRAPERFRPNRGAPARP